MLAWSRIIEGAVLSALAAAALALALIRPRRVDVVVAAALAAATGPAAWNAILRAVHAPNFFTDAPVAVFPASWQDTGSGVFALAAASVVLGLGVLAEQPARRAVAAALLAGVAAFLVDVYLY